VAAKSGQITVGKMGKGTTTTAMSRRIIVVVQSALLYRVVDQNGGAVFQKGPTIRSPPIVWRIVEVKKLHLTKQNKLVSYKADKASLACAEE